MSGITQLVVGTKGSLGALKSKWIATNHSTGHEVKLAHRVKNKTFSFLHMCYSAPIKGWSKSTGCRAHMKLNGPSTEDVTVTSVDLTHTCGTVVTTTRRKRNYNAKDIASMTDPRKLGCSVPM